MTAVEEICSRMAAIAGRFGGAAGPATTSTAASSGSGVAFANALARASAAAPVTGPGAQAVAIAAKYLGVPYVWGGTDPATGLDCSGLTQLVYRQLGVDLPRVSTDQAKVGTPVVSLAQAQPGDLLAFGSPVDHVGIYLGQGQMIEAPHPGAAVRVAAVAATPTAIRRVLPADGAGAGLSAGPPYAAQFAAAAARTGVPVDVLTAVAEAESDCDPNAVSSAGARGIMQLMPATARELGVNPMDPAAAIDGAARLLAADLQRFGSLPLALAAYNAAPAAVARYGGIPPYPQTQAYVRRVLTKLGGAA
jgi:hypothetical protein